MVECRFEIGSPIGDFEELISKVQIKVRDIKFVSVGEVMKSIVSELIVL